MNKVFFKENFQFSLLVLYWTKNLSKAFALWRSHQYRFLKQDFNGSRSSWLDSWLFWIGFNLIMGSKEIDPTCSHQSSLLILTIAQRVRTVGDRASPRQFHAITFIGESLERPKHSFRSNRQQIIVQLHCYSLFSFAEAMGCIERKPELA
jgi:hypothetical protein